MGIRAGVATWLLLAALGPGLAAAQENQQVESDGIIDSVDEAIAVVWEVADTLGGDQPAQVQAPTADGQPMAGPSVFSVGSRYVAGAPVEGLAAPELGMDDPSSFHYVPADSAYYGGDNAWVGYQIVVDVGTDWQDTWAYLEVGVGLSKPGLPGAIAPDEITNDPFEGVERTNSMVWAQGLQQAVTGFAQGTPGLDLFQSAYVSSWTHLGGGVYGFTTFIPDPTYDPTFVVSWGDGEDLGSVGYLRFEGDPLGTQDPLMADDADEVRNAVASLNSQLAAFAAGDITGDRPDDAEDATDQPAPPDAEDSEDAAGAEGSPNPTESVDPSDDDDDLAGGDITANRPATESEDPPDDDDDGPLLFFIIFGVVIVVVVIGGVTYFLRGVRGSDGAVTLPTAGEDRTGGEKFEFRSDVTDVPLDFAATLAEVRYDEVPDGAPLSLFGSLVTRAEAMGLPERDGWQLLEFDLAFDYLNRTTEELPPTGPDDPYPTHVSLWELATPPGTPIDGNVVGVWYHEDRNVYRVATCTDPTASPPAPEVPDP